jgi:hypothetical protein
MTATPAFAPPVRVKRERIGMRPTIAADLCRSYRVFQPGGSMHAAPTLGAHTASLTIV